MQASHTLFVQVAQLPSSPQAIASQIVLPFNEYPDEQDSHTPFVQVAQSASLQRFSPQAEVVSSHVYPVEQTLHIPSAQDSQLVKLQGITVKLNSLTTLPSLYVDVILNSPLSVPVIFSL